MASRNNASANKASLLGYDTVNNQRLLFAEETTDTFAKDNEVNIEELSKKVQRMVVFSDEFDREIKAGSKVLDDVTKGLTQTQGILEKTMNKLQSVSKTSNSRHICYLVIFIIVVFLILYYLFK